MGWTMRAALIIGSFLPFAFFGYKDNAFHFRGRKVSAPEHLLHVAIGLTQAVIFIQALKGNLVMMFVGLALLTVSGAADEYIFHRELPAEESDLHAKQHFALFIFVVVAIATTYLERHGWQLPVNLS
jgi:hypothetical protein